ncbi:MAG: YiiD C-terminal domain-containing protein [Spirochaetales bacterium]|nr:YiiD C-terminal domain-containing protein [Spirochaetales bacterium]
MSESEQELQTLMTGEIPLARCAGFKVETSSRELVEISGTLEKNSNHHNTVFGGSIAVSLILSGWAMVRELMKEIDPEASIVVARQSVDYLLPVTGDFISRCLPPEAESLGSLRNSLEKKNTGKITVEAGLFRRGESRCCAVFTGLFVVKSSS